KSPNRRFGEVAGGLVARLHRSQRRHLHAADLLGEGAARVKAAARGRVDRTGHLAAERHVPAEPGLSRARNWHGREQRLGVWMVWPLIQVVAPGELDDLPNVHHRDAVAHLADD